MHRFHVLSDDQWAEVLGEPMGEIEILELEHLEGDLGHMGVVYRHIPSGDLTHVCRSDMAWEDRLGECAGLH